MWDLPTTIDIEGITFRITNKCDYRMVLDCWKTFKSEELTPAEKITEALYIFLEDFEELTEGMIPEATKQMIDIISGEQETKSKRRYNKPVVDFEKDFAMIASALLPILGYDIRGCEYLHWWTFLGAFQEIREGIYAKVLRIRAKQAKGEALSKDEREFYRDNRDIVDIIDELTDDEKEFLFGE